MRKKWLSVLSAALLVLAAVLLIAGRRVPRQLTDLLPEDFCPESSYVHFFDWNEHAEVTGEQLQTLWGLLNSLEYRYDGKAPGGIMKGELYHLSLFQLEPPEHINLFVTKKRGIVYLEHREYEMLGDTRPLLEYLDQLK